MSNRPVIVLTGATHGIGRAAALELARRGARLGLVTRKAAAGEETRAEIRRQVPEAPVDVFVADLAALADVRRLAREIDDTYARLDVLVNNAGLHGFAQRITGDGLAEMVAVNYLAPWLLTDLLRRKLVASSPARVVNVASDAHRAIESLDPEAALHDTAPFDRHGSDAAYARSKLMDILFTQELARRLEGTGVTANACCPGLTASGLGRESKVLAVLSRVLDAVGLFTPEKGAEIVVRLATAPDLAAVTGAFCSTTRRYQSMPPTHARLDLDLQRRLWEATARLLAAQEVVSSRSGVRPAPR